MHALCKGRRVFALERDEDRYRMCSGDEWVPGRHTLGAFRPREPLKAVVFRPREALGKVIGETGTPDVGEQVVIGVKNCDLSALKIHDHVFLKSDPVDPYYKAVREKTLIVSCDCTDCTEVCFCTAVGQQPYPKSGFDINLSPVDGGYVVETGSERGEKALERCSQFLDKDDGTFAKRRDERRAKLAERVAGQAAAKGLSGTPDFRAAVEKSAESSLWETFAEDCVECGACNFVCCTCHCFLLGDGVDQNDVPRRLRQWDSCLLRNFARVAGGANPRSHRAERLYNRFDKKFSFFPRVLGGEYACDGCGRCVEACTGRIDIREVLKGALDER
jgi:hypothetical protein